MKCHHAMLFWGRKYFQRFSVFRFTFWVRINVSSLSSPERRASYAESLWLSTSECRKSLCCRKMDFVGDVIFTVDEWSPMTYLNLSSHRRFLHNLRFHLDEFCKLTWILNRWNFRELERIAQMQTTVDNIRFSVSDDASFDYTKWVTHKFSLSRENW